MTALKTKAEPSGQCSNRLKGGAGSAPQEVWSEPRVEAVRVAGVSDLHAVTRIVTEAYAKYVARIGKPPAPMTDDYRAHIRNHSVYVAEYGGTVAGIIVLIPKEDHLLLDNIAVRPAYHGRGIGRSLLRFAECAAAKRGFGELRLYTHEQMTENLAIYPALGWEETGRGEQAGYRRVFFRKRVSL